MSDGILEMELMFTSKTLPQCWNAQTGIWQEWHQIGSIGRSINHCSSQLTFKREVVRYCSTDGKDHLQAQLEKGWFFTKRWWRNGIRDLFFKKDLEEVVFPCHWVFLPLYIVAITTVGRGIEDVLVGWCCVHCTVLHSQSHGTLMLGKVNVWDDCRSNTLCRLDWCQTRCALLEQHSPMQVERVHFFPWIWLVGRQWTCSCGL